MSLDTDKLMERRRQRRAALLWKVVAALSLTALVAVLVARTVDGDGDLASKLGGEDRIARVTVDGVIFEDRYRDELLQELKEDEAVKAVIVRINSPGGTVVGGENLYLGLRTLSESKPVVAVMGSTATSAAYMTAIGTDRIFARKGTLTGSIGVIMQTANLTKMLDKIGVRPETFKSGELKAQPNPMEDMSPEARKHLKQVVMDMYELFISMVAERREMDIEAVKDIADGRVFIGEKALEAGLIDAIGGEQEAVAWLESEQGIETELDVVDEKPDYPRPDFAERVFGSFGKMLLSERLKLDGLLSVWQPDL